jgi:signal transduction histidine kinase
MICGENAQRSTQGRAIQAFARSAESATVPLAIVRGPAHEIVYANPAFCGFLGCDAGQLQGQSFVALCVESNAIAAVLDRALTQDTTQLARQVTYSAGAGTPRGTMIVQPLAPDNRNALAIHVIEDLTLTDDLQHANEQLVLSTLREQELADEARAAKREVEILYEEARQAVRLRDEVLAVVSHDLRNPLSAITLSAQRMLERLDVAADARKSVELIQRSASHMRSLVDELLDVASIHTAQLQLDLAHVGVEELIDEALAMLEPQANKKSIALEKQLAGPGLSALCDRERTIRVLANLLGNAIKFTPARGRVSVSAEHSGREIRLHVRDSGPGIPQSEWTHLFERYWKGSGTGRSGMGLGLYIARGIVEAQGGQINVASELGVGTSFSFSLPAP